MVFCGKKLILLMSPEAIYGHVREHLHQSKPLEGNLEISSYSESAKLCFTDSKL